jgi:hypothetical protein
MISVLSHFLMLLVGFAVGCGFRELIARHRRALARAKFYQRHPEHSP